MEDINLGKVTISSLDSYNKKEFQVSIPVTKTSEPKAKDIDITMINTDIYCVTYCLKRAQVFIILIKDILY